MEFRRPTRKSAITLVLHTWTQTLQRHLHVHALMANGALGEDGQWKQSRRGFLFPVKALSKVFREKFIDALKLARVDGGSNDFLLLYVTFSIAKGCPNTQHTNTRQDDNIISTTTLTMTTRMRRG